MTPVEVDTIAKYIASEVCRDDVFEGDQTDAFEKYREEYRGHARAVLRLTRMLGWTEPERRAG